MTFDEYRAAQKLGRKEYQRCMMQGKRPTLEVLDEILPSDASPQEVSLGLVQIPIEQIMGTRTVGRSSSFAANFMPLLDESSEFAAKWQRLSEAHVQEGIRDPIKAYEYMNKFYVVEGNKRVSVMKFYGAVAIPGHVTRIKPPKNGEKENRIYYEFLDFYEDSGINNIWFSEVGSFPALVEAVGKQKGELWDEDDKLNFVSIFAKFREVYDKYEQKKDSLENITPGDAFLKFIKIHDYKTISALPMQELRDLIQKTVDEFMLLGNGNQVSLKMNPEGEQGRKTIIGRLFSAGVPKQNVAFVYGKSPSDSAWTYAHELGRLYLEQTFPDEVTTCSYENTTLENLDEVIEDAITQKNCNLIFLTSPVFLDGSVKYAVKYPNVAILDCSLTSEHHSIRTYYARMHEAKFLMGAIAGALAEHDRVAYIADYPIAGTIANINAFALGAKMINPRVRVNLLWSSQKDINLVEKINEIRPDCVSGLDMVVPAHPTRNFGLYQVYDDEYTRSIAMPIYNWGKFYERLIRTIMAGNWNHDASDEAKSICYWWGLSADVVDVVISKNVPIGTKRLVDFLKHTIKNSEFNPFQGVIYSQTGLIQASQDDALSPEEIISMDWLAENIDGCILHDEELNDDGKLIVKEQGVMKTEEEDS